MTTVDRTRGIRLSFSNETSAEPKYAPTTVLSAVFLLLPASPGICRLRAGPKASGVKLPYDGPKEQQNPCFGGHMG